jgi:hypothetical protein
MDNNKDNRKVFQKRFFVINVKNCSCYALKIQILELFNYPDLKKKTAYSKKSSQKDYPHIILNTRLVEFGMPFLCFV